MALTLDARLQRFNETSENIIRIYERGDLPDDAAVARFQQETEALYRDLAVAGGISPLSAEIQGLVARLRRVTQFHHLMRERRSAPPPRVIELPAAPLEPNLWQQIAAVVARAFRAMIQFLRPYYNRAVDFFSSCLSPRPAPAPSPAVAPAAESRPAPVEPVVSAANAQRAEEAVPAVDQPERLAEGEAQPTGRFLGTMRALDQNEERCAETFLMMLTGCLVERWNLSFPGKAARLIDGAIRLVAEGDAIFDTSDLVRVERANGELSCLEEIRRLDRTAATAPERMLIAVLKKREEAHALFIDRRDPEAPRYYHFIPRGERGGGPASLQIDNSTGELTDRLILAEMSPLETNAYLVPELVDSSDED